MVYHLDIYSCFELVFICLHLIDLIDASMVCFHVDYTS